MKNRYEKWVCTIASMLMIFSIFTPSVFADEVDYVNPTVEYVEQKTNVGVVPSGYNPVGIENSTDIGYNAALLSSNIPEMNMDNAYGIAGCLWTIEFGRINNTPVLSTVEDEKVLELSNQDGKTFHVYVDENLRIQRIEDDTEYEYMSVEATVQRKNKDVVPPTPSISSTTPTTSNISTTSTSSDFRQEVVDLLEEWKSHDGGHSQVVAAYNQHASDYGRSHMESDDAWCSETVSAAYAFLGYADKIGGMASNGFTYEENAEKIGAWVSDSDYVPTTGDILITHDKNGDRHTACVVSCDGETVHTIAGGGSGIHHGEVSVGASKITGYVVPLG